MAPARSETPWKATKNTRTRLELLSSKQFGQPHSTSIMSLPHWRVSVLFGRRPKIYNSFANEAGVFQPNHPVSTREKMHRSASHYHFQLASCPMLSLLFSCLYRVQLPDGSRCGLWVQRAMHPVHWNRWTRNSQPNPEKHARDQAKR